MVLDLICSEWINANKNAHLLKKKKNNDKNNINKNSDSGLLYLLQIVGNNNENESESTLACLSSDQIINVYDQNNLKLITQIKDNEYQKNQSKTINDIGFFKQSANLLFSCGDNGQLKIWDHRILNNIKPSLTFDYCKDRRELLCADVNSNDSLIATGTTRNVDDSLIYIYDIRFNDRYLHKLSESHSKDITQIKFDPLDKNKFTSASLDGLICLYNLDQNKPIDEEPFEYNQNEPFKKNDNYDSDQSDNEINKNGKNSDNENDEDDDDEEEDPDLMDQVLNADASISRIGYLKTNDCLFNQLYAITYTNELLIWDLLTHDLIKKYQSHKFSNTSNVEQDGNYDSEFSFFDCFYLNSNLVLCLTDKNGNVKLIQNDECVFDSLLTKNEESTINLNKRRVSHRDSIRSSYWNDKNLFTVGEDGYLIKWEITQAIKNTSSVEKINDVNKRKKRDKNDDDDDESEEKSQDKIKIRNEPNYIKKPKKYYKN